MTVNNTKTNIENTSLDELLSGMTYGGKYGHLQLILSRNGKTGFDELFLMVTTTDFNLIKLIDNDFKGNYIHIDFKDVLTGCLKHLFFDVEILRSNSYLLTGMTLLPSKTQQLRMKTSILT